jgi:hypothetical protein
MPLTSASVNPFSTQVLGAIPAILRNDNGSYYSPGQLVDDAEEKIVDNTTSTIPENSLLLMVVNDVGGYGTGIAIFHYAAGVVTEVLDSANLFAAGDTDTELCLYVGSTDLFIKNRTGVTLAAGEVRLYRLL